MICPDCNRDLPLGAFERRTGQTYWVAKDGRAWPAEPILPLVREEECNNCYAVRILRETQESVHTESTVASEDKWWVVIDERSVKGESA